MYNLHCYYSRDHLSLVEREEHKKYENLYSSRLLLIFLEITLLNGSILHKVS